MSTVYNGGDKPLGKIGEIGDKLGGKDRDVNTDGLVTTTSGMESSTGFRNAPQNHPIEGYPEARNQRGHPLWLWTQHILFSLHRWEMVDYIQESLISGTAVICERYAWSGVVYSYVSNPRMPVEGIYGHVIMEFCNQTW